MLLIAQSSFITPPNSQTYMNIITIIIIILEYVQSDTASGRGVHQISADHRDATVRAGSDCMHIHRNAQRAMHRGTGFQCRVGSSENDVAYTEGTLARDSPRTVVVCWQGQCLRRRDAVCLRSDSTQSTCVLKFQVQKEGCGLS